MMQDGPSCHNLISKYRKEKSVLFPPYNGSSCFRGTASGQAKVLFKENKKGNLYMLVDVCPARMLCWITKGISDGYRIT